MWAQQHGQTQQPLIQNKHEWREFVSDPSAITTQRWPGSSPSTRSCSDFHFHSHCQVWEMRPVVTIWLSLPFHTSEILLPNENQQKYRIKTASVWKNQCCYLHHLNSCVLKCFCTVEDLVLKSYSNGIYNMVWNFHHNCK